MKTFGQLGAALALLGAAALAAGCHGHHHHHHGADAGTVGPPSGAVCAPDSTLTYDSFGRDFFGSYCTRCHSVTITGEARGGAPKDHDFDTLDEIRLHMEHCDQYAAAGPSAINVVMPPDVPAPTEAERWLLGEWLACGCPE